MKKNNPNKKITAYIFKKVKLALNGKRVCDIYPDFAISKNTLYQINKSNSFSEYKNYIRLIARKFYYVYTPSKGHITWHGMENYRRLCANTEKRN